MRFTRSMCVLASLVGLVVLTSSCGDISKPSSAEQPTSVMVRPDISDRGVRGSELPRHLRSARALQREVAQHRADVERWNRSFLLITYARQVEAAKQVSVAVRTSTRPATEDTSSSRPVVGTATTASTPNVAVIASDGNFPCGGELYPPCYVADRESGNQYFRSDGSPVVNPTGCSGTACWGRWQFGGFWSCHFGLSCDIAHWSPAEQDYAARTLWDHGRGCGNWAACNGRG